ncbi:hypothetical protein [Novosphingobium resinovorum]|nr:hypothetical protein [Novosphingobium resinovorum]
MNSTRLPFESWLAQLAPKGYDDEWIGRNMDLLRRRWEAGIEMQLMPMPPVPRIRDRYEEL